MTNQVRQTSPNPDQTDWHTLNEPLEKVGYPCTFLCCATLGLMTISLVALLAIGCAAVGMTSPGPEICWMALGLTSSVFVLNLYLGNFKKRKVDVISTALFSGGCMLAAALGITSVLTTAQVGWSIIGLNAAGLVLLCVGSQYYSKKPNSDRMSPRRLH